MSPKQHFQKHRAIAQTRDLLRLQHKALSTERTYLHWLSSYIDWLAEHGRDLPDTRTRIEAFLTRIAHQGCAASSQNQAFNALLYHYEQVRREKLGDIRALRAKRPQTHRTALDRVTTLRLLDAIPDVAGYPTAFIARLLYGCGLRVSEPLNLRIKDIDLPGSHMHPVNIQRAVKHAAQQLGLDALATPHILRHCYATHVVQNGTSLRDLQSALGHAHIETTSIYLTPDGQNIPSPLDAPR